VEKWDNSRSGFPAITSPHTFLRAKEAPLTLENVASPQGQADQSFTPKLVVARKRPPPEPWQIWLFMAGRGAGKTRTGAEYTRYKIRTNKVESQDQLGVTGRGI
jgi:phage terminase large subunit-like protein